MFKIVSIGDAEWVGRVMGLPRDRRDIHMDQRMLAPYVVAYKWKAYLALTESEDGYIIQPILLTTSGEMKNAYNFGGPIASNEDVEVEVIKEHSDSLKEWAKKHQVNSEYCTLIPNLAREQIKALDFTADFKKLAVVVDLTDMKVRGTTRRLANRAQGMGVEVRSYSSDFLSYFIQIYNETMERVNAKDHWRFTSPWFQAFDRFVKPCIMLAKYDGQFIAGCLIAYSQQYPVAYYHFAGCKDLFLGKGINQQMVLAACEFIKLQGIQKLFLGGGITDKQDDGLLVFKSGFSPLKQPVYTYERSL